ncbi:MAG: ankyrin repeat domain-containing protein [Proteobacteria bacterium]|nr:ankyrin repeat domain-containing protein [Pseudomonadota bacterium]
MKVEEVPRLYGLAKAGHWMKVLAALVGEPELAATCSRYKKPSSLWTFLHQTAYHGQEDVARALIRIGASTTGPSSERETPADVANKQGHKELARLLQAAARAAEGLWEATSDPRCLPSSSAWDEWTERRASREMRVAYGGSIVAIRCGARYFADAFERTLVGWHGSYDPPSGMDDGSMIPMLR